MPNFKNEVKDLIKEHLPENWEGAIDIQIQVVPTFMNQFLLLLHERGFKYSYSKNPTNYTICVGIENGYQLEFDFDTDERLSNIFLSEDD